MAKQETKDLEKELEKVLEQMAKITAELEGNVEGLEDAKKEAKEQIDKAKKGIILSTENGAMFVGSEPRILAILASIIHTLIEDETIDIERVIDACIHGIADLEGKGKLDKERVVLLLEEINEHV